MWKEENKKSIWTLKREICTAYNTSVSKVKIFQFAFQRDVNTIQKFSDACISPAYKSDYFADIA